MITIPLTDIKSKIKEQKGLSEEEINSKIKAKLEQLSGLISEDGAAHIIANELGVKLVPSGEKLTVKNILAGMRNVEVVGKVTRKFELREFEKGERKGKIASLMISDETGFIRIVFWNDQTDKFNELKEGDTIKIQNGYVRENNGRKEIHLNDSAKVEINPAGVVVNEIKNTVVRKKLSELKEGDDNVEVLATIVQVFDPRFFEIDTTSGKRAIQREGKFYVGEQETTNIGYNYVLNLFLDDGTDNVRTVLWKSQIQRLLGKSDEEILKYKDNPAEFEAIKNELLGEIVKIIGRTNMNQAFNRLELVANLVYKDVNPQEEAKKLQETQNNAETAPQETASESVQKPVESQPQTPETQAPTQQSTQPIVKETQSNEVATPKPEDVLSEPKPAPVSTEDNSADEEEISIEDLENI